MTVAATNLTSGQPGASTVCTTASISPAANRLLLLAVQYKDSGGANITDASLVSVVGNGLTWVKVATTATDTSGVSRGRMWVWRALGASPTPGTVVITFSGAFATNPRVVWVIDEFSSVDTSGTDGSGAVVQSVAAAGTNNTPLSTLAAFGDAANATYGACGHANGTLGVGTFAAGSGFAELVEVGDAGVTANFVATEFRNDNDTTVDGTLTDGSIGWGVIALELLPGVAAFTGSAALTGTGSLSAAGQASYDGAAALSGTGSLSAAGQVGYSGSASLSGTSTLTATGQVSYSGAAELSGVGSLNAVGVLSVHYAVFEPTSQLLIPPVLPKGDPAQTALGYRLFRHYRSRPQGISVFIYSDDSVSEDPPDGDTTFWAPDDRRSDQSGAYITRAFYGGHTYTDITNEEAALLIAEGYTVS